MVDAPCPAHVPDTHPQTQQARVARVLRGLLAATFSTVVALVSHVLAGAAMPGLAGIAVPLVFATSACVLLADVRLSWLRLSVSVLASQALFHLLFVVGAASTTTVLLSPGAAHLGHDGLGGLGGHGGHTALTVATSGEALAHAGHSSGWMWVAHAAAAAVTIMTLHQGERVLSRLRSTVRRVVSLLLPVVPRLLVPAVRARPAASDPDGTWVPVLRSVVSSGVVRRGPPAAVLV